MQEPLDKIRIGQLRPESITLRILVPDTHRPWAFPCRAEDLSDEPTFRERAEQISRRHTDALTETVAELADLGLVGSASADVRVHGGTPTFKLYILNGGEAFFGFYPLTEHTVALGGEPVPMYDLMGKDVTVFHYEKGDDPGGVGDQSGQTIVTTPHRAGQLAVRSFPGLEVLLSVDPPIREDHGGWDFTACFVGDGLIVNKLIDHSERLATIDLNGEVHDLDEGEQGELVPAAHGTWLAVTRTTIRRCRLVQRQELW